MADYEPRGRTDLERDDNLYNQRMLQRRVEARRFPGATRREDTESELVKRQIEDKTADLQRVAKMAVVVGGAAIVGSVIGKRNIMQMMSWVGEAGYQVRDRVYKPIQGLVDDVVLGQTQAARSVAQHYMGANPKRLTPDLATDLQKMYSMYSSADDQLKWLHGQHGTGVDWNRDYLETRYFGRTAPEGLSHLTVADVLNNSKIRNRFDQNTIDVLKRAKQHKIISDDFGLSESSTFGLFKDEAGKIVDTQFASPMRMFDAAHDVLRKIEIPVMGWKPADIVFGAIRPFLREGRYTTIGGGMEMPSGVKTGHGFNFTIGDVVFSQRKGTLPAFDVVAENVKVYDIDRPGSHFIGRAVSAKEGRLAEQMDRTVAGNILPADKYPIRNFLQRVQELIGVGPEYATNRSAVGMVKDMVQRHAIDRGSAKGAFVVNEYVPRRLTLDRKQVIQAHSAFRRGKLGPQYTNVDEYLDEAVELAPDVEIPFLERMKEKVFGDSRVGSYYVDPPSPGFSGTKVGEVPHPRKPMQGYVPAGKVTTTVSGQRNVNIPIDRPLPVGPGGVPAQSLPATGVVDKRGPLNTFNVFMHHATDRLNQLIGFATGMGFRPTPGQFGWVGNLAKIYGMAAGINVGLEYAKYADFLAGEALDFVPGLDDTTPSEYAVEGYTGFMVARQKLRESVGIQQTAEYMEDLMPGSWELPGMTVLRTAGPPALGAMLGGRGGLVRGLLGSALIGGTDVGMESEELEDIYEGKQDVPIMKSRWWMLGLQPFGGNEVDYYRPHWAARYLSNFRYTDVQYGSKSEYFAFASEAPTPHNLFGLTKLVFPDHYAAKHEKSRPYPFTATGDAMHSDMPEPMLPAGPLSSVAERLGYEPSPGTYSMGESNVHGMGMISTTLDQVTELGGIYKFFAEQMPFYEDLFGGRASEKYAANAGTITSFSREFYDESLGGLLGMTELLRRFLSPDQGRQGINYIPNEMPDWLPGARSAFGADRDYYVDFTLGDPYARVPMGEARLPGPGYESIRPLHSQTPGVYDAFDRYRILADIAPYSDAFKHYRTIVQSWAASGALDTSWRQEFEEVEEQVKTRLEGPAFTPRRFSGIISGTPEELAEVNKYSAPEKVIGAAWETLTHDIVPSVGKSVPVLGTIFDRKLFGQRSAYESYLEDQVYGVDFHDWGRPIDSFVKPRINTLIGQDPFTALSGGAGLGLVFGATPLGAAVGFAGGVTMGLASGARAISTGHWKGGWTPSSFDERNELEEYFDALEYERAQRNMRRARKESPEDVYRFQSAAQRTAVGMNYDADGGAFLGSARFRLGSPMKKYAWHFLRAPEESRQEIMAVAPQMARPLLSSAWARQGDTRFRMRPSTSAGERSRDILEMYGIPSNDWAGWAPDVPMDVIKIRTLDSYYNQAYDMHRYNLWESDRTMADRSYPGAYSAF